MPPVKAKPAAKKKAAPKKKKATPEVVAKVYCQQGRCPGVLAEIYAPGQEGEAFMDLETAGNIKFFTRDKSKWMMPHQPFPSCPECGENVSLIHGHGKTYLEPRYYQAGTENK